jgi:hypothetical protein
MELCMWNQVWGQRWPVVLGQSRLETGGVPALWNVLRSQVVLYWVQREGRCVAWNNTPWRGLMPADVVMRSA